jgi:hypothetical protein
MRLAISNDDGRIGIPPNPSIIEGSWQKTPSEMEEQIKNLNQWAGEVAQYLPLLATKEDLKAFATKEDLQATKEELKAGLEDAKRYTENLTLVARREIRQIDEMVRQVDQKVTAIAADLRDIAKQVVKLSARGRRKSS